MRAALLIAIAAGCGGGTAPPQTSVDETTEVPTVIEAQPAGPDDLEVAKVNGKPVYGSCVQAQAEHFHLDARAALDQCIAFELLAQAADARGLRADPEVSETWRRELARAVIRDDLGSIKRFDQLPAEFLRAIEYEEKQVPLMHRRPLRISNYVRADVPKKAQVGGPEDLAAKALAEAIYAEVADDEGVLIHELIALAERIAAERGDPRPSHITKLYATPRDEGGVQVAVLPYRQALFEIPAIGGVHAPVRTPWGWDLILWIDELPATDFTEEIFVADLRRYFGPWSDAIAKRLGLRPEIDAELLATLAEPEDEAPPAPEEPASP